MALVTVFNSFCFKSLCFFLCFSFFFLVCKKVGEGGGGGWPPRCRRPWLHFYTNELMFGLLTTERKKKKESYPFKLKVKEPYQIKIKPKAMTKDMFLSNILIVEAIIKYKMLRYNMSYKQVTRNIYLNILPTTYHEELMAKVIFSISLLNFFQWSPSNLHLQKKVMIFQKSNLKYLCVN